MNLVVAQKTERSIRKCFGIFIERWGKTGLTLIIALWFIHIEMEF